MKATLTINDRPTPASPPERKAPGCTTVPNPWRAGSGAATVAEPWAANEIRAAAMTAASGDEASLMTDAQRAALSALIHSPAQIRNSRWARRDHAGDIVWAAVLVLLLGLSVDSLLEGLRFVRSADALQTTAAARPHVDAVVARRLGAPGQSSGVVRRTM